MSARLGRPVTRAEAHIDLSLSGTNAAVTNRQTLMIARDGREVTREEAHSSLGHDSIRVAVTNRQTAMIARDGREVTREEAHSSLGHDGIRVAVTNRQTAMSARDGREVTRAEAHSSLTSIAGNRSIETAGGYSLRLQRTTMPMDERRALASAAWTIDDDRGLCTNGCGRVQITATNPLCQTCVTKKSKRKREEDEESGICAECDKKIVGRIFKGCLCNPCYQRRLRKTVRVIDPTKLCTHLSGCDNKKYMGGLCQRHYRERRLEASAASESAATASAATAPKKKRPTKTRNGKKKTKTKKPVVIKKDGKTVGLRSVDYEDEEVEVEVDSDDDDDDWAEDH